MNWVSCSTREPKKKKNECNKRETHRELRRIMQWIDRQRFYKSWQLHWINTQNTLLATKDEQRKKNHWNIKKKSKKKLVFTVLTLTTDIRFVVCVYVLYFYCFLAYVVDVQEKWENLEWNHRIKRKQRNFKAVWGQEV